MASIDWASQCEVRIVFDLFIGTFAISYPVFRTNSFHAPDKQINEKENPHVVAPVEDMIKLATGISCLYPAIKIIG